MNAALFCSECECDPSRHAGGCSKYAPGPGVLQVFQVTEQLQRDKHEAIAMACAPLEERIVELLRENAELKAAASPTLPGRYDEAMFWLRQLVSARKKRRAAEYETHEVQGMWRGVKAFVVEMEGM